MLFSPEDCLFSSDLVASSDHPGGGGYEALNAFLGVAPNGSMLGSEFTKRRTGLVWILAGSVL